jgi:uncharacterized protein
MPTKQLWLNLPVKNLEKSKTFFKEIGFTFNEIQGNTPVSACLLVGEQKNVVMLFEENVFGTLTQNNLPNASSEILISFDAESKEEVDEMAKKVESAGGELFSKPNVIQGWMYGFGFSDLDGHRWNMIFMDI